MTEITKALVGGRLARVLPENGLHTLEDLTEYPCETWVLRIPGIGLTSFKRLQKVMLEHGLEIGSNPNDEKYPRSPVIEVDPPTVTLPVLNPWRLPQ